MTLSYHNEMNDVIGVNLCYTKSQLNPQKRRLKHPYTTAPAALGLPSKLYWSWFLFFSFQFERDDLHYSDLKFGQCERWVSWFLLWTVWLWKLHGVYSRWNVFCVSRWHSNRCYIKDQGTEKRRETTLIEILFKSHTILALEERWGQLYY